MNLGDREFFALVKGQKGDIIVHPDPDHKKKKTIQQGEFYLADFDDDSEFRDVPHLFMENRDRYDEMILPNGLPTASDHQRKLVRTDEKIQKVKSKNMWKEGEIREVKSSTRELPKA